MLIEFSGAYGVVISEDPGKWLMVVAWLMFEAGSKWLMVVVVTRSW